MYFDIDYNHLYLKLQVKEAWHSRSADKFVLLLEYCLGPAQAVGYFLSLTLKSYGDGSDRKQNKEKSRKKTPI